jgi:fatty-acid desaturase
VRREVWRVDGSGADAVTGKVVFDPVKAAWNGGMLATAVVLGPATLTPDAFAMFLVLTYGTLLLGHSVGMHRWLIHRSYQCNPWLARVLVYLGVLVGMAGPHGVLRIHDLRDWAQRLPACHDFFSHRRSLVVDALWQLTCRFEFAQAPRLRIDADFAADRWLAWMERTWMLQQLPLALLLWACGGWPWVVWGIFCRVAVSVTGHWVVTYLCHNPGPGRWLVRDAGVQASNLRGCGLVTMGECWHNNHHAFPESARMGLEEGQTDPGWWVLRALERAGWAWNLELPRPGTAQGDLQEAKEGALERLAPERA